MTRTFNILGLKLGFYITLRRREVDVDLIKKVVCKYYGIKKGDVFSKTKTQKICEARQIIQYLTRLKTLISFEEIGEYTGGRDHSTVIHSFNKIGNIIENPMCAIDRKLAEDIKNIKDKL